MSMVQDLLFHKSSVSINSLNTRDKKIAEFSNSADLDEVAHHNKYQRQKQMYLQTG